MIQNNGITDELVSEILENVKILLNLDAFTLENTPEVINKYESKLNILTLYIKMICNNILIKTNRRIFPEDLKYVVVNLVKNQYELNLSSEELQSIQSMTEDGRTVDFGVSNELLTKINMLVQNQIAENEQLINRYRLVYKL